ncbi:MAG: FkbM family methyltransferase [Alphaproteobacteria bacterium]|nr:FkbM family methyltransferase [Alphaproteobacteria bacterium]MBM3626194.1 FkbM family methyltransferase [Alphaproteobacteria bacterium]
MQHSIAGSLDPASRGSMSDQPSPPAPEWVHWLAWATRRFQPRGIDRVVRMLYPPGNDRPIRSVVDYDEGLLFHCDTQSFLEWYIFFYGAFRPEVSRLINRMLRPGQVAIDIGANVGMHSVIMANRVGPTGRVVVFEPDPHPMGRLRRNMALNGIDWVTTVEAAVSARSETRTFYLHDDSIGNFANASLVAANVGKQTASVEMQVVSIDEWMRDNPLPRVDVVKLLAQGEEYNALQGMRGLIERDRPKIFFLYEPSYWQRQGLELMDVVRFFAGHGYGVQEVEFRARREVVGEIPKGQVFLATP